MLCIKYVRIYFDILWKEYSIGTNITVRRSYFYGGGYIFIIIICCSQLS